MNPPAARATRQPEARASSLRVRLQGGTETTLHVARYDRRRTAVKAFALATAAPLLEWARKGSLREAIVGGFFMRPQGTPLGELRIDGSPVPSRPFDAPWDSLRSCVHSAGGVVTLARRDELSTAPEGDLLQAGPMLVRAARCAISEDVDPEGFSSGAAQFDSDITVGRYPRSALGINSQELFAVVCDGRAERDAGLSLREMAETMIRLGAREAINLDGGGSASLVSGGELLNRPREEHGQDLEGGRAISTALAFVVR